MTGKHTPGPWFQGWITNIDKDEWIHISSPVALGTAGICDLPMFQYGDLPPSLVNQQREANARLIAAAPELLDLAKDALTQLEKMDFSLSANWNGSIKTNIALLLNAAIAKAEGRE